MTFQYRDALRVLTGRMPFSLQRQLHARHVLRTATGLTQHDIFIYLVNTLNIRNFSEKQG